MSCKSKGILRSNWLRILPLVWSVANLAGEKQRQTEEIEIGCHVWQLRRERLVWQGGKSSICDILTQTHNGIEGIIQKTYNSNDNFLCLHPLQNVG